MTRKRSALFIGIFSFALAALAAIPVRAAQSPPPALRVSGNQIVTQATGCTMRLLGVDIDSLEYDAWGAGPWSNGQGITETVQEAITNWNVNIIRLPLNQDYWFGTMNSSSSGYGLTLTAAGYQSIVDAVVALCSANGVYVDLDLHWSSNGTPGSATKQYSMPDANSVAFWSSVAARYANNPAVLFDLFNEPFPSTNGVSGGPPNWPVWEAGGLANEGFETPGMWQLLNTVRGAGADNVCIIGGCSWSYDETGIANPTGAVVPHPITDTASGDGIVYAAHIYNNKSNNTASGWEQYVAPALQSGPVLVEEFGPNDSGSGNADDTSFDESLIPWLNGSSAAGNTEQHVYSGMAWNLGQSGVSPALVTDWNWDLSQHGAVVMGWLTSTVQTFCPAGTPTNSPTISPTFTVSPFETPTPSFTVSPTSTDSPTGTATPTPSNTPSPRVVSRGGTETSTATPAGTPATPTETSTVSPYVSATASPTASATYSASPTPSPSPTASPVLSATDSATVSVTFSSTSSPSNSPTATASPSASPSFSVTATPTASPTLPPATSTPTASPVATLRALATVPAGSTPSASPRPRGTVPVFSASPTASGTRTATASPTATCTTTPSASPSPTATASPTATLRPQGTLPPTPTPTLTSGGPGPDAVKIGGQTGGQLAPVSLLTSPNPGRDRVLACFNLNGNGPTRLALFDLSGREVGLWSLGTLAQGAHTTWLNVSNLSNGIYILNLSQDQGRGCRSLAFFKVALIR